MNQIKMQKAKRDPKMMTNVKKNVKKMRMVTKMRKMKVPGASDDSMSLGGVHGVRLSELAVYDWTAMIDTETDAAILAIATDKMQIIARLWFDGVASNKARGQEEDWVQNSVYIKASGNMQVETYYCLLRYRCKCKVQLSITRSPALVALDWTGGQHTTVSF
jgi:hypothetical protein